jgi:hypothetical protein
MNEVAANFSKTEHPITRRLRRGLARIDPSEEAVVIRISGGLWEAASFDEDYLGDLRCLTGSEGFEIGTRYRLYKDGYVDEFPIRGECSDIGYRRGAIYNPRKHGTLGGRMRFVEGPNQEQVPVLRFAEFRDKGVTSSSR